jgi:hypothetical protein
MLTRRLRIRARYRATLDEDQLALAFLMLAKSLRETERAETDGPVDAEGAGQRGPR